jgi:hypothetical protein
LKWLNLKDNGENTMKINKKPIMPNTKNKPILSVAKAAAAVSAIKNLIPTLKNIPPVTANDRTKMQVAKVALATEIQKTQVAAAKNAVGKTAAPPVAQLAAQQTVIGTQLPSVARFLPPEIAPATVTFAAAIESMKDTIAQLDVLIANPVAELGGGSEFQRGANTREF